MKRILLVGGSSGGHVYPLMAVANALRQNASQKGLELELLALGSGVFINTAARENNVPFKSVFAGRFRRYLDIKLPWELFKTPFSFAQSLWYLFWFMPDAVFSKGGYDSIMPVIAAWLYHIPTFVHESDSVPGLANRLAGRVAKMTFLGFDSAASYFPTGKTIVVGNPVRPEISNADRTQAFVEFELSPNVKTIFVSGGSQGAQQINTIILDSLAVMAEHYQIIHQCGQSQYTEVKAVVDRLEKEGGTSYGEVVKSRYRLYPFLNVKMMAFAYAAADVIISRAGAGSVFEIAAVGKPAVLIPLSNAASDHQLRNAIAFSKTGIAVVEGLNMTTHILLNQIESQLDPAKLPALKEALAKFAKPEAAQAIARTILV